MKWGRLAFDKGFSLAHIEAYLQKRGMNEHESLKALHEITSFEKEMHEEVDNVRKLLISIPILLILLFSALIFLYLSGALKLRW